MRKPWFICSWRMAHWCILDVMTGWIQRHHSDALERQYEHDYPDVYETASDRIVAHPSLVSPVATTNPNIKVEWHYS